MNVFSKSFFTAAVASFVALSAHAADPVKGQAAQGQKKAEMCIGCHGIPGYQNTFPEIHKVPMISGQSEGYLIAALTAYNKGERRHPTMRGIAGSLTPQDMADLAAYFAGQGSPSAGTGKTSSIGAQLVKSKGCATCHGETFNKPIDGLTPKLGGQHADYLFVALKSYTVTNNQVIGRKNPTMSQQINGLKPNELSEIAKFLSAQDSELATVPQSRFR